MNKNILCSIATYNRYFTTLPLVVSAVLNQTMLPDKIIFYDDNEEPKDLRDNELYRNLFQVMALKGIDFEWVFALKKGQHHSHQMANTNGFKWVWRVDDDLVPEPNVLKTLYGYATTKNVGAVGGATLTPAWGTGPRQATGKIENIYGEPNMQWGMINSVREVDHLHCSFLYRAGIQDYNLALSRKAHREETLFSYGLKQRGYRILVVPDAISWHLKFGEGGIRTPTSEDQSMYEHDERIFQSHIGLKDQTIVVMDNGMGDHLVAKRVISELKNPACFTCYPDIIPGRSIAEANQMFGDLSQWNIYRHMDEWNWKGSLEDAFRKLYNVDK